MKTKDFLVKIQHLIPRDKTVVVKVGNKYYRIKELG